MRLPPAARDLIERLLCDVEDRLGTAGGAAEIKVRHPCTLIPLACPSACLTEPSSPGVQLALSTMEHVMLGRGGSAWRRPGVGCAPVPPGHGLQARAAAARQTSLRTADALITEVSGMK